MADLTGMLMAASGSGGAEPDPYFNQTTLLLHGDGTNGAQNNAFLDSSSNTFTITRNGNTTQGTFSPFSAEAGKWSNYFDGVDGTHIEVANDAALEFDTGDFTIEVWVNRQGLGTPVSGASYDGIISKKAANTFSSNDWVFKVERSSLIVSFRKSGGDVVSSTSTLPLGEWTHIAVVRSGTTMSLFFNGTREGTATDSTNYDNTRTLRIGFSQGNIRSGLNGYLSNLLIAKSAKYDPTQTTITVPTAPLTTVSNTGLLTCQSNRFVDNSTNGFTVTSAGNASVQPFSPFAPSAAYSASVNGGSGYFDGTGDNLSVPADSALAFGTGDFTVEGWFYTSDITRDSNGASQSLFNISSSQLRVYLLSSTGVIGHVIGAGSASSSSTTPIENAWNHFAICRSGSDLAVMLNGERVQSTTNTTNLTAGATSYIGSNGASGGFFLDYIANFRVVKGTAVYDPTQTTYTIPTAPLTAVSGTELLLNFTNAGIFDNTGKNNLETVGNAQVDTSTKKFGTGSMEFDGTGDYLNIYNPSPAFAFGTGDFTVEFFFYLNGSGKTQAIYDPRTADASDHGLIWIASTDVLYYFADGATKIDGTTTLSTGVWYHAAVCRSSGTTTLYLNGSSEGSFADSINYAAVTNFRIGQRYTSTALNFDGLLDEFRVTSGVARYTAAFTPPTAPFPDQ